MNDFMALSYIKVSSNVAAMCLALLETSSPKSDSPCKTTGEKAMALGFKSPIQHNPVSLHLYLFQGNREQKRAMTLLTSNQL